MDSVNKTLYIPLYGKAMVSKKGIILHDPKAEMIWEREGFPLKRKSKSKWLAYYMGMRSAVFDSWTAKMLKHYPEALVLHLGCGMDSRCERVGKCVQIHGDAGTEKCEAAHGERQAENEEKSAGPWYDVDFPSVIAERRKYYAETGRCHMVEADARKTGWIADLPKTDQVIVIMEGISMYLTLRENVALFAALQAHFGEVHLLVDCYTEFAAKASKYKNPVNDVGAQIMSGVDYPEYLADQSGLTFVGEHEMTPESMISQLDNAEQKIFRAVYGGKFAKKLYRLYEYACSDRNLD